MRTLMATNQGDRWFFLFGFEKSELANVGTKALLFFERDAEVLLRLPLSHVQLDGMVALGSLG